jgi:hypothetical protein
MIIIILGPGSTRSGSRKESCMSKKVESVVEKSVVEVPTVVTEIKREAKQYGISAGKLPEENQKPLGLHGIIITEAITALVNEGKTSASRDVIMAKAVELGLYTKKPSKQGTTPIFSWWRKPLRELGWINY